MFSIKYTFYPDNKKTSIFDFYELRLASYLASLYKNGQIAELGHWNIVEIKEAIEYYCIIPEKESLSEKYFNSYCQKYFDQILEYSCQAPSWELLGETIDSANICTCKRTSFYILCTYYTAIYPPIVCGDCGLPIPLYNFPKPYGNKDYSDILLWEKEYQACDTLYMLSNVGERYGYQQMAKLDSPLSKEGIQICEELTTLTGKPFFYFLHKAFTKQKDSCPRCGSKWKLENPLHGLYAYKCDKCFLVSMEPII